jgi:glycosyltransferase involved in cell wall biosynthesis
MARRDERRERLRILQVILSRGFAGSERAAAETCNALAMAHDVAIAVRRDHRNAAGASIRDYLAPGVQVFELPGYWRTRAALGAVVERWRPDVVHTHLRRGTRHVAQLRAGVPHVATLHIDLNGPHYMAADALCCISPWQVRRVERAGYDGAVLQIPNSLVPQPRVSPERRVALREIAGAGPHEFLVGGVGRLARGKGFDVLIEAFRRAALPQSRLVIVGEGRERARLERRAAGLPVTLTGFRDDAKDWFQAFDLFVSASRREPFGRVIIEALDAGTPVVASDAQGPRDIAARYPIELTPADDPEALAAVLRRAHRQPRARLAVDLGEFHLERVTASLLEAYRALLERHPSRLARPATTATSAAA